MTNQEPQGEQPATAGEWRGCPCLYTEPCNPRCTCVSGWSSRGCSRCASYGSLKQRQSKARSLAADHNAASRLRIAEEAYDRLLRRLRNGMEVGWSSSWLSAVIGDAEATLDTLKGAQLCD